MEWIRVEDELPETDVDVLVMFGKNEPPCQGVMMGHRSYRSRDWVIRNSYGSTTTTKITHWMPLPDPPKEEGPFFVAFGGVMNPLPIIRHRELGEVGVAANSHRGVKVCERLNEMWKNRD